MKYSTISFIAQYWNININSITMYKFSCSIFEFDYKHYIRLLYKSTLTNANLNVLKKSIKYWSINV